MVPDVQLVARAVTTLFWIGLISFVFGVGDVKYKVRLISSSLAIMFANLWTTYRLIEHPATPMPEALTYLFSFAQIGICIGYAKMMRDCQGGDPDVREPDSS